MIDIDVALDAIVLAFQNLPDVVTAMNGSKQAINSWVPSIPDSPTIDVAVERMGVPEVLITFLETNLGERGDFKAWVHTFEVYVKLPGGSPNSSYNTFFKKVLNGRTPEGIDFQFSAIIPDCDPMDEMSWQRRTIKDFDFYVLTFSLVELNA